jgi:glycosyltransferase involved in cell wall biosynthesis
LPEVVGDAAISFEPDNLREMVQDIYSVLTNNELHADLRTRSLKRAAQFNWQKTAIETIDVYQEAILRSKKK